MNHPNIIGYKEYFTAIPPPVGGLQLNTPMLYIIMSFADGGDLEGRIKQQQRTRQPFHESTIMSWVVQMLLALKHVHDKKILHRGNLQCIQRG